MAVSTAFSVRFVPLLVTILDFSSFLGWPACTVVFRCTVLLYDHDFIIVPLDSLTFLGGSGLLASGRLMDIQGLLLRSVCRDSMKSSDSHDLHGLGRELWVSLSVSCLLLSRGLGGVCTLVSRRVDELGIDSFQVANGCWGAGIHT